MQLGRGQCLLPLVRLLSATNHTITANSNLIHYSTVTSFASMSQQQSNQQRPNRPPQSHRPNQNNGNAMTDVDAPAMTPRKRANEQKDEERPNKQPSQQDVRQQQQNGGGNQRGGFRGGMRGGARGGRGGGQQQHQPQWQSMIPHPNEQPQFQQQQFHSSTSSSTQHQPQQQRPQSAAPQQNQRGQQQQQRGRGGGNPQHQPRGGNGEHQRQEERKVQEEDSDMGDVASSIPASSSSSAGRHVSAAPSKFADASFKTEEKFASLGLSAKTAQSLAQEFKYETMSIVQAKCIPVALSGKDIVAKAKTGTGKTLAFLIPVIERVLAQKASLPAPCGPKPVRALVISPTRELAQQIEEEAKTLGKFHGIRLCCAVGGLNIKADLRALQGQGLDLLIATPGRLKDLLQNHAGIQASLSSLVCLVLDEADRLLDMGFKPDLDAIFALLPPPAKRQTQLFSATFPSNVQEMTQRTLKKDHTVVNTVGDEDDQTHQHVVQESVIVPLQQQYEALYELLQQHKQANPNGYKVIVFFTTARVASFSSRLFNQAGFPTLELHSRLSQPKRTKVSEQFRDGKNLILFSSDVSARGLDFPGVTLIIQIGLTAKDQYVHRLGRTARAGNEGHGIIILAPFERKFLNQLSDLPIQPMNPPQGSVLGSLVAGKEPAYPSSYRKGGFAHPLHYAFALVEDSSSSSSSSSGASADSLKEEAESAYRAWMGFYNGNLKICGWDKAALVAQANQWSSFIGLKEIPSIEAKTVGKMGLKGTPGLRIVPNQQRQQHGGGGGGGNGGGRGGYQGGGGGNGGGRPQSARY